MATTTHLFTELDNANKEDNARMLDPHRFKVAKDMAVMPGGPMNNNPMNVVNVDALLEALWNQPFPYGDSGLRGSLYGN